MKSFPTRCSGWSACAAAFFHADESVGALEIDVAVETLHEVVEQWVIERVAHDAALLPNAVLCCSRSCRATQRRNLRSSTPCPRAGRQCVPFPHL